MPFQILRKLLGFAVKANPIADAAFTVLAPVIENALTQHGQVVAARTAPSVAATPPPPSSNVIADTTVDVQNAITDSGMAIVPVKSGWLSKISWTQFAGVGASIFAAVGLPLTADQLVAVVVGIHAITGVVTIIFRTYFTKSVTASSVAAPK